MKFYQARFKRGVWVVTANLQPLRHLVCHTEAPFAWGDDSAECADLALSILWNYYHGRGCIGWVALYQTEDGARYWADKRGEPAFRLYQAFKHDVVSKLKKEHPWIFYAREIDDWARLRQGGERPFFPPAPQPWIF